GTKMRNVMSVVYVAPVVVAQETSDGVPSSHPQLFSHTKAETAVRASPPRQMRTPYCSMRYSHVWQGTCTCSANDGVLSKTTSASSAACVMEAEPTRTVAASNIVAKMAVGR